MKSFLRTVSNAIAESAPHLTGEALALALTRLEERADKAERAQSNLKHRMNEHSTSKDCGCDLCRVYREIDQFRALAACWSRAYDFCDSRAEMPTLHSIQQKLFTLQNRRRDLMGLPLRKQEPFYKSRSRRIHNADKVNENINHFV